jgi:very-short-patch-repair endonuclease
MGWHGDPTADYGRNMIAGFTLTELMVCLVLLLAVAVLCAVILSLAMRPRASVIASIGYLFSKPLLVHRKHFLTRVEAETLRYLEDLFPQMRVHAQVAMSALIAPARSLSPKDKLWTHRRYGQKVVDFVLQDRATGNVIALVELDDWTHHWVKDHVRDRITAAGGYPTVRLTALMRPTRASIAAALAPVLA